MESLLTQLRIPRMDVLTLERPINLVFEEPTQELAILPLPMDISRVEIGIGLPNPMTRDPYKARNSPTLQEKKKNRPTQSINTLEEREISPLGKPTTYNHKELSNMEY